MGSINGTFNDFLTIAKFSLLIGSFLRSLESAIPFPFFHRRYVLQSNNSAFESILILKIMSDSVSAGEDLPVYWLQRSEWRIVPRIGKWPAGGIEHMDA